jgi:hypothetical protein
MAWARLWIVDLPFHTALAPSWPKGRSLSRLIVGLTEWRRARSSQLSYSYLRFAKNVSKLSLTDEQPARKTQTHTRLNPGSAFPRIRERYSHPSRVLAVYMGAEYAAIMKGVLRLIGRQIQPFSLLRLRSRLRPRRRKGG